MKRIIDGVSYNTETATVLGARVEKDGVETLHQTPAGEFFALEEITLSVWNPRSGRHEDRLRTALTPKSPDEARKWMSSNVGTQAAQALEAELRKRGAFKTRAESGRTTVLYVRMPRTLKDRIETAAAKANQSVNVWALRAFERICSEQETDEKLGPPTKPSMK